MTIKDVFKKSSEEGWFPSVTIAEKVKHANNNIGKITGIKPTGISVRFSGMKWDTWFWEKNSSDNRKRYMNQLNFKTNEQ